MKTLRRVGVNMAWVPSLLLVASVAQAQVPPQPPASPPVYPPQAPPQATVPQSGVAQPGAPPPAMPQWGVMQPGAGQQGLPQPGGAPPGSPSPGVPQSGGIAPMAPAPGAPPPLSLGAAPQAPVAQASEPLGSGAAASEPMTDHDRVVGRVGVTVFDLGTGLPIAPASTTPAAPNYVTAPIVGIRYWFQRNIGVDFGVGIGWSSASTSTTTGGTTTSTDQPSPFGLAFHAGLPVALFHAKHYSFLIIPETSVGFTSETVKGTGAVQDQSLAGFGFQLGARTGAEIHFGFIGVPQLALQATVGLLLQYGQFNWSRGSDSWSTGQWSLGTTVGPHPWSIFTDNIQATYYF